jgi:hypothetical protein
LGAVVEAFWNLGALVEAQETYDGFLMWKFNIQYKDMIYKNKEHVPGMDRTALKTRVLQKRWECISRIPSRSHVAC